jgi:hypothetical protein
LSGPPPWVLDLLGLWAHKDWHEAKSELDYPSVSPMFARALGTSFEAEEVTGYSSAEVRAMTAAIDWLQNEHADHWRALSRQVRPWTRAELEAKPNDRQLASDAAQMVADFIDKLLD